MAQEEAALGNRDNRPVCYERTFLTLLRTNVEKEKYEKFKSANENKNLDLVEKFPSNPQNDSGHLWALPLAEMLRVDW